MWTKTLVIKNRLIDYQLINNLYVSCFRLDNIWKSTVEFKLQLHDRGTKPLKSLVVFSYNGILFVPTH